MIRDNSSDTSTRWGSNRFRISLGVLIIFYVVGTIGILSRFSEYFVRLTFANLVLTALLLLINVKDFGQRGYVSFSVCMFAGFAVEALGVKTGVIFGEYQYTDRMGPRLIDVPLVIGLNWAILVHAVHAWLGKRIRSRTLMAAVGATAMTAFDWVMEPVAIRLRFWVWQADTVPLKNYLAWWGLSFLLLLASDAIVPRPNNRLAPWVFGVMLIFFVIVGFRLP
jgi:putative membrane protein